jgi:release factor glutamine methyltransferase
LETAAAVFSTCSDTPVLDAQALLAHVFQKPRTWLLAHPTANADPDQTAQLGLLMHRLTDGEPLPYVLGHQEFFGLDFDLTPDVLIPRPETELLVEKARAWLELSPDRRTVADIGTGSGCIAVCLAFHISDVRVLATDVSVPALKVAIRNARKHAVFDRINCVECDLLPQEVPGAPIEPHLDLVCANLPYIATGTLRELPVYRREPTLALDGGADGLDSVRRLFDLVPKWMAPDGCLLLEIEASRGAAVLSLAHAAFDAATIRLHRDLAGRDRLVEIDLGSA